MLETDASIRGLGAVPSQYQENGQIHPVAFASKALSAAGKNYCITDLETFAVVWAVSHFHVYLYGHDVEVRTDYSAVKAVLGTLVGVGNTLVAGQKVYSSGLGTVTITHRAGRENSNADTLSRNPINTSPPEGIGGEMQVAVVKKRPSTKAANTYITDLLSQAPQNDQSCDFSSEQRKDPNVVKIINYLEDGTLPSDDRQAKKLVLQGTQFALVDNILYYVNPKNNGKKRAVVPSNYRKTFWRRITAVEWQVILPLVTCMLHSAIHGGGKECTVMCTSVWLPRVCNSLRGRKKVQATITSNPCSKALPNYWGRCARITPKTESGNKFAIVFQDFLTSGP